MSVGGKVILLLLLGSTKFLFIPRFERANYKSKKDAFEFTQFDCKL